MLSQTPAADPCEETYRSFPSYGCSPSVHDRPDDYFGRAHSIYYILYLSGPVLRRPPFLFLFSLQSVTAFAVFGISRYSGPNLWIARATTVCATATVVCCLLHRGIPTHSPSTLSNKKKKEKVKKSKNKPRPSEPSPPDAADTNGEHPTADPSNGSSNSISSKRPKKTEKDAIAKKKKKKTKRENASATENPANGPGAGKANAAPGGATKVHVEGMSVTPLKDFADVDMPPEVMRYVTLQKWKEPTPIQAYCWPVLNAGRDVVGIAETGSGKTLAFSLPAMARIVKRAKVMP